MTPLPVRLGNTGEAMTTAPPLLPPIPPSSACSACCPDVIADPFTSALPTVTASCPLPLLVLHMRRLPLPPSPLLASPSPPITSTSPPPNLLCAPHADSLKRSGGTDQPWLPSFGVRGWQAATAAAARPMAGVWWTAWWGGKR